MWDNFPNEILLEIIQYLSITDLFHSLLNINLRIKLLINKYTPVRIDFSSIIEKSEFDSLCQTTIASTNYPYLCDYLKLSNLRVPCQIQIFFTVFDLSLFANLKSLTIIAIRFTELTTIMQHKLPQLTNLTYLAIKTDEIMQCDQRKYFYRMIFIDLSCLSLRKLIVKFGNPPREANYSLADCITCNSKVTNLKYVDIDSCYMTDLTRLFKDCIPSIKRLKMNLLGDGEYIHH
ncbi:unnamed protein product [Didymodactylos carnosus]|uniref:F-box domain-containing protein n=1 Tax=Didymodactylos carnosus TaxID=1234261 RepID=A0A816B338_9BILA|nr:unnamed protein product [Didymodactylos carnosus]CAF1604908.1 unnamed protein product [Didymodactylos carnosus]CAF3662975.1 unnamed protein product [Didymodactylos carnosus]CAF4484018.1 unnamed protein product [Didymodactylos carnosus]